VTDTRRRVEIFIGPIACSCAGGPSPARQEKLTRALALKNALEKDGRFDVRAWRLGEDEEYEEGIRALRTVDGKLEYLGDAPTT